MQLEKITAPTMADALREVKRMLGSDAVILSTKTITTRRWLGLRRREVVEVMAGKGMNVVPRRSLATPQPKPEPVFKQTANGHAAKGEYANFGRNASTMGSTPGVTSSTTPSAVPGQSLMGSQAVHNVTMINVAGEISQLKKIVTDMVTEFRHRGTPQVPEELFSHYLQLVQAEVSEELACDIIRKVQQGARPEQTANPEWVRERICDQLEKLLPMSGAIERKKAVGPHVVALIGPTGVGKTTTIAKLAANLKLRDKKKVGLITIDTYRIAAIDQLRKYADLIGIGLHVVSSPEEMTDAVAGMQDCEYVLIDTAGRSPKDALKLSELSHYLEAANPDEVHLVLSTTCGAKAAELALERFGDVRVDKVIFTKIDEAAQLGVLLSVVRKLNKGLSYVTTGQDVPDDIEVGQAKRIARMILGEHGPRS